MSGKLTFKTSDVLPLLIHSKNSKTWNKGYGENKQEPGLFLVGDQGIYLMSNGIPNLIDPNGTTKDTSVVSYPKECNPIKDHEGYYQFKDEVYGGDDGVDLLEMNMFEKLFDPNPPKTFEIKLTETSISVIIKTLK
jgi:hypothetical protein